MRYSDNTMDILVDGKWQRRKYAVVRNGKHLPSLVPETRGNEEIQRTVAGDLEIVTVVRHEPHHAHEISHFIDGLPRCDCGYQFQHKE